MAPRERVLGACTAVVLVFGLAAAVIVDDDDSAGEVSGATTTTVDDDPTTGTSDGTASTTEQSGSSTSTSTATASTSSSSSTSRPSSSTSSTLRTSTTAPVATTATVPSPTTAPPATVALTADLAVYSRVSLSAGAGATRRLRVLLDNAGPTAGGPLELAIDAATTGPVRFTLESSTPGVACDGFPQRVRCSQSDSPVGGRITELIFTVDLGGATCAQGNASFDVALRVDGEAPDPDPTNNAETRSVCRVD